MRENGQNSAFARPGYRKERALSLLREHFGRNRDFMADFAAFVTRHSETLEQLSLWWASSAPLRKPFNQPPGLAAALEEAKAIAYKWGLKAEWGAGLLLCQWSGLGFRGLRWGGPFKPPPPDIEGEECCWVAPWPSPFAEREFDLRLLWAGLFPTRPRMDRQGNWVEVNYHIDPDSLPQTVNLPASAVVLLEDYDPENETRGTFLKRAREKLRQEAKAIEDFYRENGAEGQGDKSELSRHVEWLYERIALKLTPRQIVEKHKGDSKPPGQHAVEDGIHKVAQLLEITLPRNRAPFTH